jgi:toxin FitB
VRWLLDTNVLSEGSKREPDRRVLDWLASQSAFDCAVSVLTVGEIRKGVELMAPGARRARLEHWLVVELPREFGGRILPVDSHAVDQWGRLAAVGQRTGRPLPVIDGLLLATAAAHRVTFATRNDGDCARRGVAVYNPWTGITHPA